MTTETTISDLLSAPLSGESTLDGLAEKVLDTIAAQPRGQEFVLDAAATKDRQARRLLRPLLAFLATKSATETGAAPDPYGGRLAFSRPGPLGTVWIVGEFENKPGSVRAAFRCSDLPPQNLRSAQGRSVQRAQPDAKIERIETSPSAVR